MTDLYRITCTAEQAQEIRDALEACARMGIGQVQDAMTFYPTAEFRPEGWHEAMTQIEQIMQPLRKPCTLKSKGHRRLWSMMTSIRHRLSWDRAIDQGVAKEGGPRNWPEMMQTSYDAPDISDWPQITIERVRGLRRDNSHRRGGTVED